MNQTQLLEELQKESEKLQNKIKSLEKQNIFLKCTTGIFLAGSLTTTLIIILK